MVDGAWVTTDLTGRVVHVESTYWDGLTDYSAYVWNEETLSVEYAGPCSYGTKVDGPAWVAAFYSIARTIAERAAYAAAAKARAEREAAEEAVTVRWGKTVKVVRGRKVPKGTVARVFWVGENRWGWSVGLELDSGDRVFTALHNVEVVASPEATKEAA